MDITNIANLADPEAAVLETKNIGIEGMSREDCVRTVVEALNGNPGIKEVLIDREHGIASVTFDTRQIHFPEIHDALLRSGYRPSRGVVE